MPTARREHARGRHNMKTLSAISRKAHSNVLSLAHSLDFLQRDLSLPAQCHVRMSGFQVGTCPPDSHGPKAPSRGRARRKGGTGADLRKERGIGDAMGASFGAPHAPSSQIHGESAGRER